VPQFFYFKVKIGGGGGGGEIPVHATRAYRGSRGLALFIFNLGRWMDVSGQLHASVVCCQEGGCVDPMSGVDV
jgi:hypothetical protein